MSAVTITLRQIIEAHPCYDPVVRFGLEEMDQPIHFKKIVSMAGVEDAIWCFAAALPGHEALKRHFAVDCAERVRHLMDDPRSLAALEVARRHALGQATDEELTAAWDAAWNAVWDAAWNAVWAARAAAWDAARAAARDAAWAAATAAAGAAARAAARAAGDAAWAERDWQGQRLVELTEAGAWAPVGHPTTSVEE